MNEESRYKPKRFVQQLRELSPKAYIQYLKNTKGNGRYMKLYNDCPKIHIEYKIKRGNVFYWVYDRSSNIITGGTEK